MARIPTDEAAFEAVYRHPRLAGLGMERGIGASDGTEVMTGGS